MIVPLLREMRLENLNEHENTRALLTVLDRRLGSDASAQKSFRQALSADSLMSKSATGEFEQRIEALEQKVRRLETHK
jgi:polyhydroxyalkanoate synthesis regulator phasin